MSGKKEYCRGIYRADIWLVDFPYNNKMGIIEGKHYSIIVSNWRSNIKSNMVTVVPLTTVIKDKNPIKLEYEFVNGITSAALCYQVVPVHKDLLIKKIGQVPKEIMNKINDLLIKQLQLEKEAFNEEYVNDLLERIQQTENFIKKHNLYEDKELQKDIFNKKLDIMSYCRKYNVNHNIYIDNIS